MGESFYIANSWGNSKKHNDSALKRTFDKVADFINRWWILKTILQFLPSIWSPLILKIEFISKWLTAEDGSLNKIGIGFGIAIYLFSLALLFCVNYKARRDQIKASKSEADWNALRGEISLRKTISSAENTVEQKRIRSLTNLGESTIGERRIIQEGLNPKDHISFILDEITHCITKLTPVTRQKIHISAAISIDNANWEWLIRAQGAGIASLEELLNEDNHSAFLEVVHGNPYVYHNDKLSASEEGCYYLDNNDKSSKNIGSIVCWEVVGAFTEKSQTRMILSISTTGVKLVDSAYDSDSELLETFYVERLKDIVLEHFESELIEDLLLYKMTM